jgi:hypothetical protein
VKVTLAVGSGGDETARAEHQSAPSGTWQDVVLPNGLLYAASVIGRVTSGSAGRGAVITIARIAVIYAETEQTHWQSETLTEFADCQFSGALILPDPKFLKLYVSAPNPSLTLAQLIVL